MTQMLTNILIYGAARHGSPLNFAARLHVALGSAKGILYLHTEADPPIIHRDIKASNILLDSKFNAKVSDFGISRLFPEADADASVSAHVFTYVKGTPGYVDPEYFQTHKLTEKSDVYSLGVVFLELLTGMYPISHGKHIVQEVL
ncbi:probable LRR receptor-like serine/threonine-protein kinase At1g06840 [Punica granatum]|uniref:non-specific serine/threonine protein kinase n=1 Tax=Punica granatum TaxID=22663 RepID=A0A6P8C5B1_PUNGR|nr:probable LRR receptor-like serine/threonine-protein kinase At1g06840 [Punica granatum]